MSAETVPADTAGVAETDLNIGNLQGLEFVCEHEGFRYYKNSESGRQCCLDVNGYWYIFDEKSGTFMPNAEQQHIKKTRKDDNKADKLRNVERFGIKFDHNGRPIFPKNEQGLFVLPKDEKGLPFFPVDDRSKPIFPYDPAKGDLTFPVDDSEEPIFPRNEMNKPIVPCDKEDRPIFPMDKTGEFIFPLDENNCPIPALTFDGVPVVPKDSYGNFVIPSDRDGKKLIHIASDGVTPISAAEWKQWKKFYKEQARNFYHQQQQQSQQKQMTMAADSGNYHVINSMFHPLSLEQQNVYYSADMEMLHRSQQVKPEDVDLSSNGQQMTGMEYSAEQGVENGAAQNVDPKQLKRKKFLEAQLKSVKKGTNQLIQTKKEENKKIKEVKKENRKEKQKKPEKAVMSRRKEKTVQRKKHRSPSPDRKRQRRRRYSPSSRSSSYSRSRSRSTSSRSTITRDLRRRRGGGGNNKRRRSPSVSSSSSSGSSSSNSSGSTSKSFSRPSSKLGGNEVKKAREEDEMRNRILSRTIASSVPNHAKEPEPKKMEEGWKQEEAVKEEPEEYGPKPPAQMANGSDMEMSDTDGEIIVKQNNHDGREGIQQREYYGGMEIGKEKAQHQEDIFTIEENNKGEVESEKADKGGDEMEKPSKSTKEETSQLQKIPFNVKEVLKSEQIELIRMCKEQERERYDQLKLQLAELGVALSVHKRNWTQLREAEKRLEGKRGIEFLSSSDES